MRLRDVGEFGFIDRIAAMVGEDSRVVLGIGDDAALLDLGGPELVAVTTDAMLEHQHFDLTWLEPGEVGWRAASGALSDLAAMGATPVSVFCTVGLPPFWLVEAAEALLRGVAEAARAVDATLTGGDVIAAENALVDIMALGLVPDGQQLTRGGARPGNLLAVTGSLGAPAAAVQALSEWGHDALDHDPRRAPIRARFAHPEPRVAAGRAIALSGLATAAIDISDGIIQDAGHIAERSGVRCIIEAPRIPVAEGVRAIAEELGTDPLPWILAGGEEFELLLAIEPNSAEALASLEEVAAIGLTVIGRVEAGEGVVAVDDSGQVIDLPTGGWDHFWRHPRS